MAIGRKKKAAVQEAEPVGSVEVEPAATEQAEPATGQAIVGGPVPSTYRGA